MYQNGCLRLCILVLFLSTTLSAGLLSPSKQQQWDQMEMRFQKAVDGLGKPIDPGVKDTVVVLNLLGFATIRSCEGHIDWGRGYPWIDFAIPAAAYSLMEKLDATLKAVHKKESKLKKKYASEEISHHPKLAALYTEVRQLRNAIDLCEQKSLNQLQALLGKFYERRKTSYDRMLTLQFREKSLSSIGGEWLRTLPQETKEKKLKEYQEEMTLFTNFLIDHFQEVTES